MTDDPSMYGLYNFLEFFFGASTSSHLLVDQTAEAPGEEISVIVFRSWGLATGE